MLRKLLALPKALNRTISFIIGMWRDKTKIQQILSNSLRENLTLLILASVVALFLFGKSYFYSMVGAATAIISMGPEAFPVFRLFSNVVRVISTPFDEMVISGVATAGLVVVLIRLGWNYFVSELNNILDE